MTGMHRYDILAIRLVTRILTTAFLLAAFIIAQVEIKADWGLHSHFYYVALRIPYGGECDEQPFAFDCPDRLRLAVYATRGPGGVCMSLWAWNWYRGAHHVSCLRYRDLERMLPILAQY